MREDEPVIGVWWHTSSPQRDGLGKHSFRDFLKERLPDYMVPQHFVMIESVPLLPNGKVNRQVLPAPTPAVPRRCPSFEIATDLSGKSDRFCMTPIY